MSKSSSCFTQQLKLETGEGQELREALCALCSHLLQMRTQSTVSCNALTILQILKERDTVRCRAWEV